MYYVISWAVGGAMTYS